MKPVSWKPRNVTIAVCLSLTLIIALYSLPSLETERFTAIIPQHGAKSKASPDSEAAQSAKTSRFHYLIPASAPKVQLCYNTVSAAVNRYPVPMMLGWNGTGEFDAAKTHLAKLRAFERYFAQLPPDEDDDLVLIADGYDVIFQLPPDIMIERYFDIAYRADVRLAKRFGISVQEARANGLRQTIFWGPDKLCWPMNDKAARCWAAPPSTLAKDAFGPNTSTGPMKLNDPRWLNSGTVIGPVKDLRKYFSTTMDEVKATYDPEFRNRESDQYYLANVWARQEYFRSKKAANGGDVQGGPDDREVPEKLTEDQETELHIAIEYESALFQTKAGYEPYFGHMRFNETGMTAKMTRDFNNEGDDFQPYNIDMPANVLSSLGRIYDAVPDAHPGSMAQDWIRNAELGVNFVTRHIYGLWHCTGGKDVIGMMYTRLWFYPWVKPLIRASIKASQRDELISAAPIDGRKWAAKMVYPDSQTLKDEFGGVYTDDDGGFVEWKNLCGQFEDDLFKGDKQGKTEE